MPPPVTKQGVIEDEVTRRMISPGGEQRVAAPVFFVVATHSDSGTE